MHPIVGGVRLASMTGAGSDVESTSFKIGPVGDSEHAAINVNARTNPTTLPGLPRGRTAPVASTGARSLLHAERAY
jgi:hypothetical protein